MSVETEAPRTRSALAPTLIGAITLAAVGGAAVGLAESVKLLLTADVRYVQWACKLIAIGGLGYAVLAALLALPCALFAHVLGGRPPHRIAAPSACAGLGAIFAAAAVAGLAVSSVGMALAGALAATALFLAPRTPLERWPFASRLATWWGLLGGLAAACVVVIASEWARGPAKWVALGLATASLLAALRAFLGRQAPLAATLAAGALAVLAVGAHPGRRVPAASPAARTDVLLVTIDTLRADHLGCYGAAEAKTPVIDRLAKEGVLFEDATSQANDTGPSHVTLLTGLYPAEHGAVRNGTPLARRAATLGDLLAPTHSTAAFVSGFTLAEEACGLAPRFDWYDDRLLALRFMPPVAQRLHLVEAAFQVAQRFGLSWRRTERPAVETIDAAIDWITSRGDEPLFTWVHLFDPHAPYVPPLEFARMHGAELRDEVDWYELGTGARDALVSDARSVARMKALYAGEISYADAQLGRLLEALRTSGRFERTLIVFTSDHGEGLGSHGYWFDHGVYLYDEELHVPLVVRFPGGEHAGTRVTQQVRLLDVTPTVLDVLGLSGPKHLSGASLLELARGLEDLSERPSFALGDMDGMSSFPLEDRRLSLRTHGHKLLWTSSHWLDMTRVPEREEFYELASDPGELVDLRGAGRVPGKPFDAMQRQLTKWREAAGQRREQPLDDAVIEQLRRLGYL